MLSVTPRHRAPTSGIQQDCIINSGISRVLGSLQKKMNFVLSACSTRTPEVRGLYFCSCLLSGRSPLPLVIESPMGYSTRVCLVALWEKRYFEFDPFVGGGEKMKKSAVINRADGSLRR